MQENMFRDWLHRRKISDLVLSEFNVHSGQHPIINECIVIPVHDAEGNFSFNKYRRSPADKNEPRYLYDQGGKVTLYGWHKAKDENNILITEGEMDTLVAWSANIAAVSSTGGAMSFQKEWDTLFSNKKVIICFDNDEAGGNGMAKALDIIPWARILFLPDRPGIKDISDYVTSGGDLIELLKTAKRFDSIESIIEHRGERASIWQSTWFHDAYIKNHTKPVYIRKDRALEKDRIVRARSFPIPKMMDFIKNKARCLWHAEKDASLVYYPKTNTLYCFGGCGKAYDAIDVYRQKYNCSFKEAVEKLQ